jgi:hypothetical protein
VREAAARTHAESMTRAELLQAAQRVNPFGDYSRQTKTQLIELWINARRLEGKIEEER